MSWIRCWVHFIWIGQSIIERLKQDEISDFDRFISNLIGGINNININSVYRTMVEHIDYSVIKKTGNFEIRDYPDILVAFTTDHEENNAFGILFRYIQGENQSRKKIAMTAPVISSEKIPMTSPVISKGKSLFFILPSSYSMETAPMPINKDITLDIIPKRRVGVILFSGRTRVKTIEKFTDLLLDRIRNEQLSPVGKVFLMRYNSPFTPGFLRRNEVAVEVVKDSS